MNIGTTSQSDWHVGAAAVEVGVPPNFENDRLFFCPMHVNYVEHILWIAIVSTIESVGVAWLRYLTEVTRAEV
jgi:hypothetical protein